MLINYSTCRDGIFKKVTEEKDKKLKKEKGEKILEDLDPLSVNHVKNEVGDVGARVEDVTLTRSRVV